MTGAADTRDVIVQALETARHGVEANLVLNTLVLLRDGSTKYEFSVPANYKTSNPGMAEVKRRLLYLNDNLK